MGCGCNKKRLKAGSANYSTLLNNLKTNLVSFSVRTEKGTVEVVGTLAPNSLPSSESKQYTGRMLNDQKKSHSLEIWAFNKNYDKDIDSCSGWCKIPLTLIDDYTVINKGE